MRPPREGWALGAREFQCLGWVEAGRGVCRGSALASEWRSGAAFRWGRMGARGGGGRVALGVAVSGLPEGREASEGGGMGM